MPLWEMLKIDPQTFRTTNKKGVYIGGRTVKNITENHEKWVEETSHLPINKRRQILKEYKSCEYRPIHLGFGKDDEVIKLLPPDPLHIL